jgi:pimeloyl-ACP methyl ester carboxylesterase
VIFRRGAVVIGTLVIMVGSGACGSIRVDSPAQRALDRLPLEPCHMAGIEEELLCGRLEVPEDRTRSDGRTIPLNVVVVPARSVDPRADPLVELIGSPGFAATRLARLYTAELAFLREDRDVVLVDQRGTGGSNPLGCDGVSGMGISELLERWPAEAVASCRERLAALADLSKYTTADATDDLDAVRAWLGYDRINVFGGSYGARAAQEYMRRYPERVRSAVLFGVVPPHFRRPLYYARDAQRGMDLLLHDCAADEECSRAFPAIREDLATVLGRLQTAPIVVSITHPETGASLPGTIEPFTFATVLWEALMNPLQARRLPLVIHRAATGDFAPFLELAVNRTPMSAPYYEGMHLSVTCPDETLHIQLDEVAGEYEGSFMPPDRVMRHLRACRLWGMVRSSPAVLEPVHSEIPTLLISGRMDPVTPESWAEDAARYLPNSRHIVLPHISHTLDNTCVDLLVAAFIANPDPQMSEHPCVAELRPPPFVLKP